ncbi:MAG: hypothetical protein WCB46_08355 [Methanoregula sp.]
MPADLWKSLTVQIMALGHSLHHAQCIAAVIVINCLVLYTIMGYQLHDKEQELHPYFYPVPETRIVGMAGCYDNAPVVVNRDPGLFSSRLLSA